MHPLDNVIFFLFLSFVVGVGVDPLLRRATNYEWLSGHYLFRHPKSYEAIGVLWFRRFLQVTPFGSFNTDLHFSKNRDLDYFRSIRNKMATAEMAHWVGFVTMFALTVFAWWVRGPLVGTGYVVFNVLGNLYPSMLQQYNKRRLERLISKAEERVGRITTNG